MATLSACRRARAVGLLAAMVLHGLLLATVPWPARPLQREPLGPSLPPLQVMLLSEHVGHGSRLMAPPAPSAVVGAHAVASPPPAPPVQVQVDPPPRLPDRPALPISAPNLAPLLAQWAPAHPIRLRLHIAADGQVDQVEVVEAQPGDTEFAARVAELLRRTPHIPARRDGHDVASIKDVRLAFAGAG